jgi:hypothetical protein
MNSLTIKQYLYKRYKINYKLLLNFTMKTLTWLSEMINIPTDKYSEFSYGMALFILVQYYVFLPGTLKTC